MQYHVVVAMDRADQSEAIISLHRNIANAQQVARRLVATMSKSVVRCRIRSMDLTNSEIVAICESWGRADFFEGEPLLADMLPKPFSTAYTRGYCAAQKFTRPEGQA